MHETGSIRQGSMTDRALTVLVILVSGHPVVLGTQPEIVLSALAVVILLIAIMRQASFTPSDLIVSAAFAAILLIQLFWFATAILSAILGFAVRLMIALLVVRTVRNFCRHYILGFYALSVLSLTLYFPYQLVSLLGVDPRGFLAAMSLLPGDVVHVGLQNFNTAEEAHRNSGIFWEPGAFAGYLLLAVAFLAAERRNYSRRTYLKMLLTFVVCLLTTMSTTGYLLLPLALALHAPDLRGHLSAGVRALFAVFAMVLAVGLLVSTYQQLPFVKDKIEMQVEASLAGDEGTEATRFGSVLYDFEFITQRPLLGWSPHPSTRAAIDPWIAEVLARHGNGLTGFVVKFGLAGMLVFLLAAAATFTRAFSGNQLKALGAVALVLLVLNGEAFLNHPLFMTLMFPAQRRPRTETQAREVSGLEVS